MRHSLAARFLLLGVLPSLSGVGRVGADEPEARRKLVFDLDFALGGGEGERSAGVFSR
jgi:hypothetical protein